MNLPVGHERYLSTTPGLGGKLRAAPDDFTVTELSLPPPWAALLPARPCSLTFASSG